MFRRRRAISNQEAIQEVVGPRVVDLPHVSIDRRGGEGPKEVQLVGLVPFQAVVEIQGRLRLEDASLAVDAPNMQINKTYSQNHGKSGDIRGFPA